MLRLRDFGKDNARGQVDFPKLKRGGVDASFFALYIPARLGCGDAAFAYMQSLLDETERQVAANPELCAILTSAPSPAPRPMWPPTRLQAAFRCSWGSRTALR